MVSKQHLADPLFERDVPTYLSLCDEGSEAAMRDLRDRAIRALQQYTPGRAAELQPVLDRLGWMYRRDAGLIPAPASSSGTEPEASKGRSGNGEPLEPLSRVVKQHVIQVYHAMGHNKTQAARVLEIDIKTLYNKLKRYRVK